jgi:hypothetical protein
LAGSSPTRGGIVKEITLILLIILVIVSCSRKKYIDVLNINLDGEWVCVDGDEPDIGAWDNNGIKGMIGKTAKIKNGVMKFDIVNLTDGLTRKFNFKIIYPGKVMSIEKCEDFDPTEKGSLDPKRFKFSDRVVEFKTDEPYNKYTFVVDGPGDKMILDWDGGCFLYVPKRNLKK